MSRPTQHDEEVKTLQRDKQAAHVAMQAMRDYFQQALVEVREGERERGVT